MAREDYMGTNNNEFTTYKKSHLDGPGKPGLLVRTGKLVPFRDVGIGQPFWAHDKVWIRTSHNAATQLGTTDMRRYGEIYLSSCCNFDIDPMDAEVEALTYSANVHKPFRCNPEVQNA